MLPLTSAPNAFAARILAARLGAEGIVWQLRGNVDGPYPLGSVEVLVDGADLPNARLLLLADEIDAVDDHANDGADPTDPIDWRTPLALWAVLLGLIALSVANLARLLLLV